VAAAGLAVLGGLVAAVAALSPLWGATVGVVALLGFTAGLLAAAAAVVEVLRPAEGLPDGGALVAGAGRHELPAGPKAFVGRRAEIARALQVLRRRRAEAPVATITGMPGVGKTALALVLAHHLARTEYPDDQLFISLDSRLPASPADALYDQLLAFGVPPAKVPGDQDGRRRMYLDALHGRRALVVLDDVTTAEQMRALWPPSGCAAIVTGPVELLKIFKDGADPLRLQPLTTLEAMRFLTNRIGRRRVVHEPLAALRIVRACGRLPLALACVAAHLTATRGRYLLLRSFARRLRDRRTRLDDLSVSDEEGIEPALAQIYRGLNQYQRHVFDVIGHLDAPELDAELVAAVLPTTLADAERLLAELVDEGLLEVAGSLGERWQPHELVRVFACQVAPAKDRQAVVERAVAFHLDQARNLRQVLASPAARLDSKVAARARAQLERERAAGKALVDQAARHGLDLAAALVDELVDLLFQTLTEWPGVTRALDGTETRLRLFGRGFSPWEPVALFVNGRRVGETKASGYGTFETTVRLEGHSPAAVLLVSAVGQSSGTSPSTRLTTPAAVRLVEPDRPPARAPDTASDAARTPATKMDAMPSTEPQPTPDDSYILDDRYAFPGVPSQQPPGPSHDQGPHSPGGGRAPGAARF
jgi:NB-ARC domain